MLSSARKITYKKDDIEYYGWTDRYYEWTNGY